MSKPVRVFFTAQGSAALRRLTPAQREQMHRLIQAISIAPRAGVFYRRDLDNRVLYIVSAADVHLVYTIMYRVSEDRIFVVDIEVAEWTPRDSDMP
jgi:hypothetical protein